MSGTTTHQYLSIATGYPWALMRWAQPRILGSPLLGLRWWVGTPAAESFFFPMDVVPPVFRKRSVEDRSPSKICLEETYPTKRRNLELEDITNALSFPKFIYVEATNPDQPLTKISPFAVEKGIKGWVGDVKNVKRLQSGNLIIEVDKKSHVINLLKLETLVSIPVRASPHRSLNTSKGVIRESSLAGIEDTELTTELKSQGVISAKRINQKREGVLKPTNTIILTFNSANQPKSIKAGYLSIPVDAYIPAPLRCYNCQKFGHHISNCKKPKSCAKCGLDDHAPNLCTNPTKCVNCEGDHPSYFSTCPVWKVEKEICKVKTLQNISYPEARKLVKSTTSTTTYAKKASKQPTISVGTQTESIGTQTESSDYLGENQSHKNSQQTLYNRNQSRSPTDSHRSSQSLGRRETIDLADVTKEMQSKLKKANQTSSQESMDYLNNQTTTTLKHNPPANQNQKKQNQNHGNQKITLKRK
jgi:hypothetical protein